MAENNGGDVDDIDEAVQRIGQLLGTVVQHRVGSGGNAAKFHGLREGFELGGTFLIDLAENVGGAGVEFQAAAAAAGAPGPVVVDGHVAELPAGVHRVFQQLAVGDHGGTNAVVNADVEKIIFLPRFTIVAR